MTRCFKVQFLATAVLVALVGANAEAGSFSVVPSIAGFFDEAFAPVPPPEPNTNPGIPYVVQVDFDVIVHDLAPGEDSFGNTGFNIAMTGPVADAFDLGWQANNPQVDSNGSLPLGMVALYAQNGDFGASSTDELGILVSMATGAFTNAADPRRNVGEPSGERGLLGTVFVRWDGTAYGTVSVDGVQASVKLTSGAFVGNQEVFGGSIALGNFIPEPSSLALLGSCLAGIVLRRRAA
jgi:hypothetical protein